MTFTNESGDLTHEECIFVNVSSDEIVENTETFSVMLTSSSPKVNITEPSIAVVYLTDDDGKYLK